MRRTMPASGWRVRYVRRRMKIRKQPKRMPTKIMWVEVVRMVEREIQLMRTAMRKKRAPRAASLWVEEAERA